MRLRALSLPSRFWRFYASSATSNLADGIGRTALPLLGATYTRNPVLISGLVSFAFLPWLLFALASGALVDRFDRRYAMSVANGLRAVSTAVLAALVITGHASIVAIYVASFLLGLAETVYDSASRAILPQVVSSADLDRANALLTVEETLGQTFLGAPIGSALFAVTVSIPLVLNASGFAIAALLILTLRGAYRPARETAPGSIRQEMRDGVRWLTNHVFLRTLTVLSATTAVFGGMISGVLVLYCLEVLRLPSADFGLVLLAAGAGSIVGGIASPPCARRFGRGPVLVVGGAVTGVTTAAMAFTRNGYVGAALFAVSAAGVMVWNVLTISVRQALIPHHLFGRVQGAYRTLVWGAIAIGAPIGGLIAAATGVAPVLFIAGAGLTLTTVWLARLTAAHRAELEFDVEQEALSPSSAS
jgi:MFS family permease